MAGAASAQTAIRVEGSPSTAVRSNGDQPIEIKIPKPATGVNLTTATGKTTVPPGRSDDSIDLTPSSFKHSPQSTQTLHNLVTPPAAHQENPTANGSANTPAPPADPMSGMYDDTLSHGSPAQVPKPQSDDSDSTSSAPASQKIQPFLPPADLGQKSTMLRDGIQLPLRPELLSSATLAVTIPDVYATTLTNGIQLYHYESHDLPRVRVSLLINAGSNADPADKIGLAEITAKTMRSGEANGKSGDEIDQQLEQIGSDLELKVDTPTTSPAHSLPSRNRPRPWLYLPTF